MTLPIEMSKQEKSNNKRYDIHHGIPAKAKIANSKNVRIDIRKFKHFLPQNSQINHIEHIN